MGISASEPEVDTASQAESSEYKSVEEQTTWARNASGSSAYSYLKELPPKEVYKPEGVFAERLCGSALVVPEDGLALVLWGQLSTSDQSDGQLLKLTRIEPSANNLVMRMVSSSIEDGAEHAGILMETGEGFPIAFIATSEVQSGRCTIFKPDHSLFGVVQAEEGSYRVCFSRNNVDIASLYVDMFGKHANVLGPNRELLATISPPKGSQTQGETRSRVIRFNGGVDAGVVCCFLLSAMKLQVGDL